METPGEALARRRDEYIARISIFDGIEADPRVDMRPARSRRFLAGGDDIPDSCLPDSGVRPVNRPPLAPLGDERDAASTRINPGDNNRRSGSGDWDQFVTPTSPGGAMPLQRITTVLLRSCELIREGRPVLFPAVLDLRFSELPDHSDAVTADSIPRAYALLQVAGYDEIPLAQLFDSVLGAAPWDTERPDATATAAGALRDLIRGAVFDTLERFTTARPPFEGVLADDQKPAPAPAEPAERAKGGDDCAAWPMPPDPPPVYPLPRPIFGPTRDTPSPLPPASNGYLAAVTVLPEVRDAVLAGIGITPEQVVDRLRRLPVPDDVIGRLLNWLSDGWATVPAWARQQVATPAWNASTAPTDPLEYIHLKTAGGGAEEQAGVAAASAWLTVRDVVGMLMMLCGWIGLTVREVTVRLALREQEKAEKKAPMTYFTPAGDISSAGANHPYLAQLREQLPFDNYPLRIGALQHAARHTRMEGYTRHIAHQMTTFPDRPPDRGGAGGPGGCHSEGLGSRFAEPTMDPVSAFYWRSAVLPDALTMLALADTADFALNILVRFLGHFRPGGNSRPRPGTPGFQQQVEDFLIETVPDWFVDFATASVLNLKFWITDRPTLNQDRVEMTFWSENHQILFGTGEYLAGQWWPCELFPFTNAYGSLHHDRAKKRVLQWLVNRMRFGLTETNSAIYLNEHLPPLLNLVDFAEDENIRTLAAMVIDLLVFDMVRHSCRGSFVAASVRAYLNGKASAWGVSVADALEVLTGTLGDIGGDGEETANALVTSRYLSEAPEAILAIATAPPVPVIARSRLSIGFDDAERYDIGTSSEEDTLFWWSHSAYFAEQTFTESRKRAFDWHLQYTGAFELFSKVEDIVKHLGAAAVETFQEWLVPTLLSLYPPFGTVAIIGKLRSVFDLVTSPFTSDDDKRASATMVDEEIRKLAIAVNAGSVVERLHLYAWRGSDAMLSSLIDEKKGQTSAQKEVMIANLGPSVSVFVSKPLEIHGTVGRVVKGYLEGVGKQLEVWNTLPAELNIGEGSPVPQIGGAAGPILLDDFADDIFDDGPQYFLADVSNPLVWQHENVAVAIYHPDEFQRGYSLKTHAFWPWEHFDEVRTVPRAGGRWIFGRCDRRFPPRTPRAPDVTFADGRRRLLWPTSQNPWPTYQPTPPESGHGSGYVALFSANGMTTNPVPDTARAWLDEIKANVFPHTHGWQHRELVADGDDNIWILVVGDRATYGSFQDFCDDMLARDPVFSVTGASCALVMPVPGTAKGAKGATFSVGWDTGAALDGQPLTTDGWPRYELVTSGLAGPGQRISYGVTSLADPGKGRVDFDEPAWRIEATTNHRVNGKVVPFTVFVEHDASDPAHPVRRLNTVPHDEDVELTATLPASFRRDVAKLRAPLGAHVVSHRPRPPVPMSPMTPRSPGGKP